MKRALLTLTAWATIVSCSGSTALSPNATGSGGSGGSSGYGRCSAAANCAPGEGCVVGICVPRPVPSSPGWTVEMRPPGTSQNAIITEFTNLPSDGIWTLKSSTAVALTAGFAAANSTTVFPSVANIVLEMPSLIPGRPPLSFETALQQASSITVPESLRTRSGTLRLIPLPPADQASPPYAFSALIPETGFDLGVFTLPSSNLPFGILLNAFSEPKPLYTARAYINGTQVSNAAMTQMDGRFVVWIPFVTGPIRVELAPPTMGDPWFIFNDVVLATTNQNLGTVKLPPYQNPNQTVVVKVQGDAPASEPIVNAAVRAAATLSTDSLGVTRFWRNATTDTSGNATMQLIPGAAEQARTYELTVVPPASSAYASTCVERQVPVNGVVSEPIIPPRRRKLKGVISSLGAPVSGVTVVATRDPASARLCSIIGPTTFTSITDPDGSFALAVDPGIYQVDYAPPAGSSAPRLTEFNVDITSDVERPVQLPLPALIEGIVIDAVDAPLPNATVRIFEPRCGMPGCTTPPLLRGETQTDLQGHFRAVVAAPGSN
jgi:hypothetical protein